MAGAMTCARRRGGGERDDSGMMQAVLSLQRTDAEIGLARAFHSERPPRMSVPSRSSPIPPHAQTLPRGVLGLAAAVLLVLSLIHI